MSLRTHIIRLAHENADMRPYLLKILAGASYSKSSVARLLNPPTMSNKSDVEKWAGAIKMQAYAYDPDSKDRQEYLAEAVRSVAYAASFLYKGQGTITRGLSVLLKELKSPEMLATYGD